MCIGEFWRSDGSLCPLMISVHVTPFERYFSPVRQLLKIHCTVLAVIVMVFKCVALSDLHPSQLCILKFEMVTIHLLLRSSKYVQLSWNSHSKSCSYRRDQGPDYNVVLQQLSKLPFIPDRQQYAQRCAADTNRRLHVALKQRLTDVIAAAHKAYIALRPHDRAQSLEKLSALSKYAVNLDCVDQQIVSGINKAVSEMV